MLWGFVGIILSQNVLRKSLERHSWRLMAWRFTDYLLVLKGVEE